MAEDGVTSREVIVAEPLPGAAPVPAVQCSDCGAVFSRAEHLTRHRRSHTNERPFVCSDCGKSFSRVDVLTRHAASHRESPASPARDASVFPRACRECAASRVRCSRGDPCERCRRKGLECAYPAARKRKASHDGGDLRDGQPPGECVYADGVARDADGIIPQLSTSTATVPDNVGAPDQLSWLLPRPSQPPTSDFFTDGNQAPPGFPDDAIHPMSAMNWLSPDDTMQLDLSALASFPRGPDDFETFGFPFFTGHDPAGQPAWPAPLGISSPELSRGFEGEGALMQRTDGSAPSARSVRTEEGDSSTGASAWASHEGTFYVDGGPSRAPFKGLGRSARRRSAGGIARPRDETTPGTPFPETTGTDDAMNSDVPSIQAFECMLMFTRAETPLGRGTDLPSIDQLREFFRLYFQCLHQTFPFLRRDAVFYDDPSHRVLLLAVCAVGSRYSPDNNSVRSGLLLFQGLETVLGARGLEYPFETPLLPWEEVCGGDSGEDPLSVVQAAVLNLIWKVHGGREGAGRGVAADRHRIVAACRNMGLLESIDAELGRRSGGWDWAREQSRTRTGLMIWLLDWVLSYEIGSEPSFRLGEIKSSLPCHERSGDSSLAENALHGDGVRGSVSLPDALERLYTEKRLPVRLSDFAITVLIHAVCARMREAVHHRGIPLATWVPTASTQAPSTRPHPSNTHAGTQAPPLPAKETWPPSLPILSKWRNSACDCLDVLHLNANSIIARGWGWEPPAVFHLHLARLFILTPVGPLQALAAAAGRRGADPGGRRGVDAGAREKVLRWAIDDQFKARLAVIHSGALFWHVRRHSADSFLEPFGVFVATLVLWAYSTSVQFANRQAQPGPQTAVAAGNTDAPPSSPPLSPSAGTAAAEAEEDSEPPFFHIDRPCDDETVQAYVRLGQKMAGHLSRVGDICREGAPRKILGQGREILERRRKGGAEGEGEGGGGFVWGVAGSYVEMLGRLIRSLGE